MKSKVHTIFEARTNCESELEVLHQNIAKEVSEQTVKVKLGYLASLCKDLLICATKKSTDVMPQKYGTSDRLGADVEDWTETNL